MKSLIVAGLLAVGLLSVSVNAVEPSKISLDNRRQWCRIQISTCTNICYGLETTVQSNTCVVASLAHTCACKNATINTDEYMQTIPYFRCAYDQQDCVNNCKSVESCVVGCRTQYVCAAKNPPRSNATVNGTIDDTSSSTTPTQTKLPTATLDDSAAPSSYSVQAVSYLLVASAMLAATGLL